MADHLTPAARSENMRRIRGRDTKPELVVRRTAHALGYRFRLHRRDLPGTPDLVFPRLRTAVFVHGCFWHMHRCQRRRIPETNRPYWAEKLLRNVRRDRRNARRLRADGWSVCTVWECQTRDAERLARRLARLLRDREAAA